MGKHGQLVKGELFDGSEKIATFESDMHQLSKFSTLWFLNVQGELKQFLGVNFEPVVDNRDAVKRMLMTLLCKLTHHRTTAVVNITGLKLIPDVTNPKIISGNDLVLEKYNGNVFLRERFGTDTFGTDDHFASKQGSVMTYALEKFPNLGWAAK